MELYFLNDDFSLALGPVDSFTSAVWYERYFEIGSFSVRVPRELIPHIKTAAYVCTSVVNGEIKCGRIDYISTDADGDAEISGRMLECLLADRIMKGNGIYSGKLSDAVKAAVEANLRDCGVTVREGAVIDQEAALSYGWSNLSQWLYSVLKPYGASYTVKLDPATNAPVFRIVKGADRRIDGDSQPAVFSSSYGNIASIRMEHNRSSMKNVAYVKGKDDTVVTVDKSGGGATREVYATANDIAPSGFYTTGEYTDALKKRGEEVLANYPEGFCISAECHGDALPKYGRDYFLGDVCDVADEELGLSFDMRLTSVDTVLENGVLSVFPLFGEEIRNINRMMNNNNIQ